VEGSEVVLGALVGLLEGFFEGATVGGFEETVPGAAVGFVVGSFEGRTPEPAGPF
jgi:outer membrane lipoprotein SlyB